ncbi:eukaryotic translation initiation factor 5B-like isoform X2 [Solanum dulcamara]|nr:eukaryotic translation initiation factor 5B-like isoform X2 [Solanum dulcamara]XP_055834516.1 eukaryotic translation initiation factor 5B-like isoform X2 [Solanum dulcamara]
MEDQIVERRIVEHTSLKEEEDEDDEDEGEVKESNIRWIVTRGLGLGKKVMITGIVISSTPVVLPPLIVISALGFAFSVPFGLAFASYTCTEKLMNKLLPRSEPPLLLGYGEMVDDEEDYDEQVGGKGSGFGGDMLMEEEEKKEMEDAKGGVEIRIELVMEEGGGYEGGPTLVVDEDVGRAEEERDINIDEDVKGGGYEDDVGEYLEGENEGSMKEKNLEIERGREAENWEFDEKIKETEGLDLVATEARGKNEGEKDVTLTPGLPDKNLVEVYVGDAVKEDTLENPGGLEGNEDEKITHPEVVEKPLESKDEKVDSLVRETQATKTEKGPEVTSEEKEIIEVMKKPNVSKSSKKHHKKKKANDGKNVAISEKEEGLSNKQQEDKDTDVKIIEKKEEVRDEVKVKQDEKHLPVKRETKEGKDEANQSGVAKKAKKAAEMDKTLPGSREVGQAANSTKDPKEANNGKHVANDASRPLEGKDNLVAPKEVQRKAPDVHGNLPSGKKGTTDQKKNANASGVNQVSGRAGIPKAKPAKEFLSEEKIWEKTNAMRTIVGYTAAPQPLLVDELKALYIFTGVEPPSTFRNPSTLTEVNDKLQFLMSIVGIK